MVKARSASPHDASHRRENHAGPSAAFIPRDAKTPLLVLQTSGSLRSFRKEWPDPGSRPGRVGRASDRPLHSLKDCSWARSRSTLHQTRMV